MGTVRRQVQIRDDPAAAGIRVDLLTDLWEHQPTDRVPRLDCEAPV